MKKHKVYWVNLRVDLRLWRPIIRLFARLETCRYEDEWMGVGGSGQEWMGVGGSGWEWVGAQIGKVR